MGETNFEGLLDLVRARLPDYLAGKGIEIQEGGWFLCPNPSHHDTKPTNCHFVEARDLAPRTRFKCFACGAAGDIFTAATYLDQRPSEGKAWIVDNVYWLADKFGIDHEKLELSEEEILQLRQQRLYNDAADILVESCRGNPDLLANARARGVLPETCEKFGIGTLPWGALRTALQERGWTEAFARASGIDENHFHERYLTFTLRDMNGRVIGFDRRYMDYDGAQHAAYSKADQWYPPKYLTTNQRKCVLIDKSTLLYNIHWARRRSMRRLDVFEGYLDWITAHQAGHECCTAMCGSAFTDLMVAVIRACGFSHVNLVMDGDPVGMMRMLGGYDDKGEYHEGYVERFKGQEGLHVTIMPLTYDPETPSKSRDVDYYLRAFPTLQEGLRNYMLHQPISAFDWILEKRLQERVEPSLIAKEMVQFIVNERSSVDRSLLCQKLAGRLGIPETDVRLEVERISNQKFDEIANRTANRISRGRSTEAKIKALEEGYHELATARATNDSASDPSESVEFVNSTLEEFRTTETGLLGWRTGWKQVDTNLGGFPKSKEVIVVGGVPNAGKSSILLNTTNNLIERNDEPCVVVFSLDDPRKTTLAKLVAIRSGLPIQWVVQPQEHVFPYPDLKARYDEAAGQIRTWAEEGRLVIKGTEIGKTKEGCEKVIRASMDRTGRPVAVVLDSFHKMSAGQDVRIGFKNLAEWWQVLADELDFTLMCTAEVNKEGIKSVKGKPRCKPVDLSETAVIEFMAKLIIMVHNDLHSKEGNTNRYWSDEGTPRPILELWVDKNKITSFKNQAWYFMLREHTAQLWETSKENVRAPAPSPAPAASPAQVGNPYGK